MTPETRTNEELAAVTASGLPWITVARVVTELLLIAAMIALARLIPPSAFGMFAVAVIVQELAVNVPSEGVGSALVQRAKVAREHLQAGLAVSLAAAVVLGLATLALALVLVEPVFGGQTAALVALTAPWFLLGALAAVPMALLRRRLDFRRLAILGFAQSAGRSAGSLLFAAGFGLDATALVLGGLVGMVAMVALALVFAPVPLPAWRREAARDLLPYGGPAALASVSWVGFRNGDYAIVGALLGPAQAGFYWRAYQLAVEYQGKVSQVMTQVGFPVLARTVDEEAMFVLRGRMVRLLTIVVFPALTLLAVLAPVLVPWLFGPAWEPAVVPTQILAGAGAATVVIDAVGTVLMASGRSRAMLGYGVAHFGVYVATVVVAASWGLEAVAGAALLVHGAFVLVAYRLLLRGGLLRPLRLLWDDIGAAALACAALAGVAWPLGRALQDAGTPPVVHVAAVAVAGGAAYLLALRVVSPPDARDLGTLARRVLPAGRIRKRALRSRVAEA